MKINFYKLLSAFCLLIFHYTIVYSQTKTFDYINSSLSTTACNVFNPSVPLDNIQHRSHAGSVGFNLSTGLKLVTTPNTSPQKGTAFVINYGFLPGYLYDISITALGNENETMVLNTSVVPNFNQFPTNSMTNCGPDDKTSSYALAGYGRSTTTLKKTSTTYSIPQFSVVTIIGGDSYSNLMIWASGGRSGLSLDELSISKIEIKQTAPTSFNITPGSISLQCGSASPVTFTANNAGIPATVTGYTWNLGAAPNGWLYNNVAAPATINTASTVNTLILTPDCGKALSSISATVATSGNSYQTNTAAVTITKPSLSITGSGSFCSGTSAYSIDNLPCNATVTWSINPGGIVSPSCTACSSTTLTKTGNGSISLKATVSNICGGSLEVTPKDIVVGAPGLTLTYRPEGGSPCNSVTGFTENIPNTSYTWSYLNTSDYSSGSETNTYPSYVYPLYSSGTYNISVYGTNACGTGNTASSSVYVYCSGGYYYRVSPNPSGSNVTISKNATTKAAAKEKSTKEIKEVRLYDIYGNLKQTKKVGNSAKNVQITIPGLKERVYVVEIVSSDNTTERQQLIIRK